MEKTSSGTPFYILAVAVAAALAGTYAAGMRLFYFLPETLSEIILAALVPAALSAGLFVSRHRLAGALLAVLAGAILLIGIAPVDKHAQHITCTNNSVKGGVVEITRNDYLGSRSNEILAADVPIIPFVLSWHKTSSVQFDPERPSLDSCITFVSSEDRPGGYQICYKSVPVFSGDTDSSRLEKIRS
ncbi:MAG: hypothetical protein IJ071_09215 [Ruminococcus sp.]|nr:hypothetical protein [Ruminococcus sp.]